MIKSIFYALLKFLEFGWTSLQLNEIENCISNALEKIQILSIGSLSLQLDDMKEHILDGLEQIPTLLVDVNHSWILYI